MIAGEKKERYVRKKQSANDHPMLKLLAKNPWNAAVYDRMHGVGEDV